MAINLSREITKIKMSMGIYGIHLPVDNVDDFIREIIEITTVPTFSVYQPYYDLLYVDVNDLQRAEEYDNNERNGVGYILPEFKNRHLITVSDVQYNGNSGNSTYTGMSGYGFNGIMPYAGLNMMQQMMLTNAASQLQSNMYPKLTFDFIEPCTLILYDLIMSNGICIELAFEHHKSLSTIPLTAEPSFFKLALYDVQDAFYQLAKHWDGIETVYGNINLKIDDWADARNNRNSLLEDWDNNYHLDIPKGIVIK